MKPEVKVFFFMMLVAALYASIVTFGQYVPEKTLSVDAQNKVLRIEIQQTQLSDQIAPLVREFNNLNEQVTAIEDEDLRKQGLDPDKSAVDDGRTAGPGGGTSEKTFKITPKPEPEKK